MKAEDLDIVLVPIGLGILLAYHLLLVYRIVLYPTKTVIGINAMNRRLWVDAIMKDPAKNGVLGVQTIRNNIMASTLLSSTAILMTSVIASLMINSNGGRALSGKGIVLGNLSERALSIKFFSILLCFVLAFLLNIESVRYYSHASMLLSVPHSSDLVFAEAYVAKVMNKGSYFWSLGLHAFYISLPLFLWLFGPIPMLVSSLMLVCSLFFLDMQHGYHVGEKKKEKNENGDGELEGATSSNGA